MLVLFTWRNSYPLDRRAGADPAMLLQAWRRIVAVTIARFTGIKPEGCVDCQATDTIEQAENVRCVAGTA